MRTDSPQRSAKLLSLPAGSFFGVVIDPDSLTLSELAEGLEPTTTGLQNRSSAN